VCCRRKEASFRGLGKYGLHNQKPKKLILKSCVGVTGTEGRRWVRSASDNNGAKFGPPSRQKTPSKSVAHAGAKRGLDENDRMGKDWGVRSEGKDKAGFQVIRL